MMVNEGNGDINVVLHSDFGCAVCMKTSRVFGEQKTGIKMLSCSTCRGPRRYCSKECFKKDWEELGHKEECKELAAECNIDDPKKKAVEVLELKNEANKLFKTGRYKEAICEYRKVKALAIKVKNTLKKKRKQNKNGKENVEKLCSYVKNMKKRDLELEDKLKIYHRSDPLEIEMTRLSAIAANNTAITYNKMNMYFKASSVAREALKLDPLFHYRIIPQWLHALTSLGDTEEELNNALKGVEEEWQEMTHRIFHLKRMLEVGFNEACSFFKTNFLSFKEMAKVGHEVFYNTIDKEKKLAEAGNNRFCPSYSSPCVGEKWGYADVLVSIVTSNGAQWLTLCVHNNKMANALPIEYMNLRFRPADLSRSGDEVNCDMIKGYKPGMLSHVGSIEALENAYREIILFVHDLEREGVAVECIVLGCGLFHLLSEEKDPQKDQRRHKHKADKYILHPGHYLPTYCQIEPDYYHIRR